MPWNSNINLMKVKKLSDAYLDRILENATWKELSRTFCWTEILLEKNKNNVDWAEIAENSAMIWTPSMLERFESYIDWTKLSSSSNQTLLIPSNLERFKDKWNWSELSKNYSLNLSWELIDRFIDQWDWSELINMYKNDDLYSFEFFEKYKDNLPAGTFENSRLWDRLIDIKKQDIVNDILS